MSAPVPTPLRARMARLSSPVAAYLLSPFLVGLTAWGLMLARDAVARHEHQRGPVYLTFFYLAIALIALLGGRGPGVLTTLLTTFCTALLLANPTSADLLRPTSLISLLFNLGVGALLTLGMDAVRRNRALLAQSRADAARLQTVMDTAPVGIITCDMDGALNYANPQAEKLWGQPFLPARMAEWTHYNLQDANGEPVLPEQTGLARALAGEADVIAEEVGIRQPGGSLVWMEGRSTLIVDKSDTRLGGLVMLTDVTERRQARQELENNEARFRALVQNATDIITVLDADGNTLYKSPSEARIMGYTPEETVGSSIFNMIHSEDLPRVQAKFEDVRRTPGLHSSIEFRIQHKSGSWRVLESVPSNLLDDPAIGGVVVNSRDVTLRREAEAENVRLRVLAEARAERESLLNRIQHTLRLSSDPEMVQMHALAALGEALCVDRCYFSVFDLGKGKAFMPEDWRRDDLPTLAGEQDLTAFGFDPAVVFESGATVVADDVRTYPKFAAAADHICAAGIRSVIAVPLFDEGRLTAAFIVAMADAPRLWTPEEVELTEAVASLMRTATEAARVQQREHRIAVTLQDALLPPLPEHVPSLDLDVFYKPALNEASIGGDFHDVFPLDKGLFALVVGDLSGKGLAAAAQVATVRNMLRYALYESILRGQNVAQAVTQLNQVVTEHELLNGFVTLFVGIYDAGRAEMIYVNCGQEPALLHRAVDGTVEELPPTGPVLGMATGMTWTAQTVPLASGDTLAAFTDGVSEAGRGRGAFLGVDGVAELLGSSQPGTSAAVRLAHVVSGMDAHAQGLLHDDVCLLIAVMQNSSRPANVPLDR